VIDPEPLDPQKLLSVKNPIEEAVKFIRPGLSSILAEFSRLSNLLSVLQYPCKDAEAHLTAFNVYYHKGKVLESQCPENDTSLVEYLVSFDASVSKEG